MGYLVVAFMSAAIGAGVMYVVLSSKMVDDEFEQFNRGYKLGVEDGKKMKDDCRTDK